MLGGILLAAAVSAAGFPRPESRADYVMDIRLLPDSVLVRGSTEITFVPAWPADTLWLHLYPNAYRDPSTAFAEDQAEWGDYSFANAAEDDYGWIALSGWTLDGGPVQVIIDETLGYIPLDSPARPGDTLRLAGMFDVKVPEIWSRMGHDCDHYEMSQWYPKMCVLDDRGWHLSRYHSEGEFYSDYGTYDVTIQLPDSFVTAATGDTDSVWLSPDSLARFEHWSAGEVHDFAWAADPAFVRVEHNFIYPDSLGGNVVRVHVAVRECDEDDWAEVGAWADSTLLYYGEWYGAYPYPDLWVVQSATWGGMEYPQLVVIGSYDPAFYRYFEMVVMHEIGHQWFYGLLGNDEVEEAWLDEGINSFSELRYFDRKYGLRGNMTSLPGWIADASDTDGSSASYVGMVAGGEEVPVLSTSTDAAGGRYDYGALYYSKPALFMRMLQEQMGSGEFDAVMHEYFSRFCYHHPRTEDLQAVAEEMTGRSWQAEFDTWLRTTGTADVRVDGIDWRGDSTLVTVTADVPIPVDLGLAVSGFGESRITRVRLDPGDEVVVRVPGHWWRAEIDPETRYLDRAPWNNSFPESGTIRPFLYPYDQLSRFNTWLMPIPGWADGAWEAGLYGMTRAGSPWSGGPLSLSGFWRQPFTDERPGVWALSLERTLSRSRSGSSMLSVDMGMGYGREDLGLNLSKSFQGPFPSDPSWSLWGSAGLSSVSEDSIIGPEECTEGHGAVFAFGASRWSWGMAGSTWISAGLQGSPDWASEKWLSASLEASFSLQALPGTPGTRLFAGRVWGEAPLQNLYRAGGGLRVGGPLGWMLPPDGDISTTGHYFVESGPALPGYGDSNAHGRVGIGFGETIRVPAVPVSLFADAGWVAGSTGDLTADNMIADAGIGLDATFVQAWFPAWVSDPQPGEDEWEFRWRIAFSLWGLPFRMF